MIVQDNECRLSPGVQLRLLPTVGPDLRPRGDHQCTQLQPHFHHPWTQSRTQLGWAYLCEMDDESAEIELVNMCKLGEGIESEPVLAAGAEPQ